MTEKEKKQKKNKKKRIIITSIIGAVTVVGGWFAWKNRAKICKTLFKGEVDKMPPAPQVVEQQPRIVEKPRVAVENRPRVNDGERNNNQPWRHEQRRKFEKPARQ